MAKYNLEICNYNKVVWQTIIIKKTVIIINYNKVYDKV